MLTRRHFMLLAAYAAYLVLAAGALYALERC